MIRLGLCCKYMAAPIRFRTTTATHVLSLPPDTRLAKLSGLARHNAEALTAAIRFNAANGIGGFRINSQILPLRTHPTAGYAVDALPDAAAIVAAFRRAGALAADLDVRLSFHPDQFVVLNSPRPDVVAKSIEELSYQAEVADWVGADVINIHGGGAYGDKTTALTRLKEVLGSLPTAVRARLTLENDDRTYTPQDLLPVCRDLQVPLVYDVHHHRCLPDELSVADASEQALATWDREPLFHLSSPREGWDGASPNYHHDYIDPDDFPPAWSHLEITVDVEAKAKELAVVRLERDLVRKRIKLRCPKVLK